jgi:uncharacterized OB-fold protein
MGHQDRSGSTHQQRTKDVVVLRTSRVVRGGVKCKTCGKVFFPEHPDNALKIQVPDRGSGTRRLHCDCGRVTVFLSGTVLAYSVPPEAWQRGYAQSYEWSED